MHSLTDKVNSLLTSDAILPVYTAFTDTVRKHGMADALCGGLAIGFSGGPDSVMLLLLLMKYRQENSVVAPLLAIHVNHMIRGKSADRDAEFSAAFCGALGVEIALESVDVPKLAEALGTGIEETARQVRYTCFRKIIDGRNDLSAVALAHNSTDNVETVVLNMLRGSGVRGMCGIPPVRDIYYRPLIAVAKSDILDLLDAFEIPYAVDETNASTDYTRNYVRHNVLPHFEKINPAFDKSVARLTDHMRLANDLITSLSDAVYEAISGDSTFAVGHLRGLHPAVLADLISRIVYDRTGEHPDEGHINAIAESASLDNFRVSLKSADFVCQQGICFFDFRGEKSEEDVIFHLKLGENRIQGTNLTVYLELGPEFNDFSSNIYNYSIYADLNGGIIDGSVYLRTRRDGDSYRYNGMTRRLKKVFNDYGIPPFMRDGIPIICDRDGILWVVGLPVRDGARPVSKASALRITVLFDDSDGRTFYPARKFNDANI